MMPVSTREGLGPLANYIDYERFGRDVAMEENGRFTDEGMYAPPETAGPDV
jgi:hypothetical protein